MSAHRRIPVGGLSAPIDVERLAPDRARVAGPADHDIVDVEAVRTGDVWHLTSSAWARPKRVRVVVTGARTWVLVDGRAFECEVGQASARRSTTHGGEDALRAPMPATVVRVPVSVGQTVARDAVLIVLEAMKMELALKAPHDGVITRLSCAPGQLVGPDDLLVVVEPTA